MKTLIKICGITSVNDAQTAVELGADALGLVFYRKSSRYITYELAREICREVPENILKFGVFVNEDRSALDRIEREDYLTHFQFSGDEDPETCTRYASKAVKAFRISASFNRAVLERYRDCAMYLFDANVPGSYGGAGETFDWNTIKNLSPNRPFILAGGLTEQNVGRAIRMLNPFMVDVSSGVESEPGRKDAGKIRRFIEACRKADGR